MNKDFQINILYSKNNKLTHFYITLDYSHSLRNFIYYNLGKEYTHKDLIELLINLYENSLFNNIKYNITDSDKLKNVAEYFKKIDRYMTKINSTIKNDIGKFPNKLSIEILSIYKKFLGNEQFSTNYLDKQYHIGNLIDFNLDSKLNFPFIFDKKFKEIIAINYDILYDNENLSESQLEKLQKHVEDNVTDNDADLYYFNKKLYKLNYLKFFDICGEHISYKLEESLEKLFFFLFEGPISKKEILKILEKVMQYRKNEYYHRYNYNDEEDYWDSDDNYCGSDSDYDNDFYDLRLNNYYNVKKDINYINSKLNHNIYVTKDDVLFDNSDLNMKKFIQYEDHIFIEDSDYYSD
jgi:hypothetical protein